MTISMCLSVRQDLLRVTARSDHQRVFAQPDGLFLSLPDRSCSLLMMGNHIWHPGINDRIPSYGQCSSLKTTIYSVMRKIRTAVTTCPKAATAAEGSYRSLGFGSRTISRQFDGYGRLFNHILDDVCIDTLIGSRAGHRHPVVLYHKVLRPRIRYRECEILA